MSHLFFALCKQNEPNSVHRIKWFFQLVVLVMGLGAGMLSSPVAQAQEAENAQQPASWTVNCATDPQNVLRCTMSQTLALAETGRFVLNATIQRQTDSATYGMIIRVTHGISIPAGVALSVDGTQLAQLAYETSDQAGLLAVYTLDAAAVLRLKVGKALNAKIKTTAQEEVDLALNLTGFSVSYDRLVELDTKN